MQHNLKRHLLKSYVASNSIFLDFAMLPPPTHGLTNEHSVLGKIFSLLQFHDILSAHMHHRHPPDLPGFNTCFYGL